MTDATMAEGPAVTGSEPRQPREVNLRWALVLISVAQLMVVLDGTITNIALPYIGRDLAVAQANLSWIVTGYALAFGGLLLLGGRLGDLYGRRRVFATGLTLFALASLLGGLAQNEAMLLGSRALQGVGAALAAPAALALITTTFPAGPKRNRAFAVYAAMSGAGAAVGLILGGWLTGLEGVAGLDLSGWRLTFLINVPIGLVAAFLAPRVLRESESQTGQMDVPGAVTGTLGLLGLVYGLTRAGEEQYGWGDPWTLASLAAGVALLAVFTVIESRAAHPLLPIRILKNRTRAASFTAMMLAPAAMFAMFYFLSLFIQQIVGYSPLRTGFAFLPFSFGIVIGAALSSNLVNRVDPRFLAGTGTLLASTALFMFSRLSIDDSPTAVVAALAQGNTAGTDLSYWTSIFPFVLLMAIGMGLIVRAADPHRGAPRACRGLRHRVRRAQHDAADRWRARPGHAEHGVAALRQQPGRPDRAGAAQGHHRRGHRPEHADPRLTAHVHRGGGVPGDVPRGRLARLPGRLDHDARRLADRVDVPQRQARGAGHRRTGGRARRLTAGWPAGWPRRSSADFGLRSGGRARGVGAGQSAVPPAGCAAPPVTPRPGHRSA